MAYLTREQAVRAAQSQFRTRESAAIELRKSANTSPSDRFDIFLSHSSEDAEVIAGVKLLLESDGLSVYVDWLRDPQLDRSQVTAATADLLRKRMNNSGYLLYASSQSSSASRWMPWELGYFDGRRPKCVGVLPVVARPNDDFDGIEYLGLYPLIERVHLDDIGWRFARVTGPGHLHGGYYGTELATMARA